MRYLTRLYCTCRVKSGLTDLSNLMSGYSFLIYTQFENDIASHQQSPSYHFNNDIDGAFSKQITHVDGAKDLQIIFLSSLTQPSYAVSAIFAVLNRLRHILLILLVFRTSFEIMIQQDSVPNLAMSVRQLVRIHVSRSGGFTSFPVDILARDFADTIVDQDWVIC